MEQAQEVRVVDVEVVDFIRDEIHVKLKEIQQALGLSPAECYGVCTGPARAWDGTQHANTEQKFLEFLLTIESLADRSLANLDIDTLARLFQMSMHMHPEDYSKTLEKIYNQEDIEVISSFCAPEAIDELRGYVKLFTFSGFYTLPELIALFQSVKHAIDSVGYDVTDKHKMLTFPFDIYGDGGGHATSISYDRETGIVKVFDINRYRAIYQGDTAWIEAAQSIYYGSYPDAFAVKDPMYIPFNMYGYTVGVDNKADALATSLGMLAINTIASWDCIMLNRTHDGLDQMRLALISSNYALLHRIQNSPGLYYVNIMKSVQVAVWYNNLEFYKYLLFLCNISSTNIITPDLYEEFGIYRAISNQQSDFIKYLMDNDLINIDAFYRDCNMLKYLAMYGLSSSFAWMGKENIRFTLIHYRIGLFHNNLATVNFMWEKYAEHLIGVKHQGLLNDMAKEGKAEMLGLIFDKFDNHALLQPQGKRLRSSNGGYSVFPLTSGSLFDINEIVFNAVLGSQPQILHLLNARDITWGAGISGTNMDYMRTATTNAEVIRLIEANTQQYAPTATSSRP